MAEDLLIKHGWALGDCTCLSAVVRDLARAYPRRFRVAIRGHYTSFWANNPYVVSNVSARARVYQPEYLPGLKAANAPGNRFHFLSYFHTDISRKLKLQVPVTAPKGDIHLSPAEAAHWNHLGRYWLIAAGGKYDMTAKVWAPANFQAVVDGLAERGIACIQVGAVAANHFNPVLKNCKSLVGATPSIRDVFSLVARADGVVCGVTSFMHIAAVFERPCVVLAGGREMPHWEHYGNYPTSTFGPHSSPVKVPHIFLDTIGKLDCCRDRGCWKKRTVAIEPGDSTTKGAKTLCTRPLRLPTGEATPKCLDSIKPQQVIDAVLSYYACGTLPPITEPAHMPTAAEPILMGWARHEAAAPAIVEELPAPALVPAAMTPVPDGNPLEHPLFGGRLTAFVLCHGEYPELAANCIGSIQAAVPADRLDLRVGANQVGTATENYLRSLGRAVTKIYWDNGSRRKYAAMREMFHDRECPIVTPYLTWFDDDAKIISPDWLKTLCAVIKANHAGGGRLYGIKFMHDLSPYAKLGYKPQRWFQTAAWWKKRNFLARDGRREAANGSCLAFVAGWFWALATETIRKAGIPDERLNHNGGDCTIGEQVRQSGAKLIDFNRGKQFVWTPDRAHGGRRGFSESFPWSSFKG